ncbi:MAG TPA: acyl-CoA dehydrogenase family protein, partial [Acidimicrobiia bacterium]|nr:acyl-CoA dehydrogenase family protein [Acidimicrobiia bacterium]
MDLRDSPEAAAFRSEARAFLDAYAPTEAINTYRADVDEEIAVESSTAWQRTLYEHGWAAITWPEEARGRGLGPVEQIIWNQELARAGVTQSLFMVGVGMVGPTLIVHGTPEQKARHPEPILSGDHVGCQLRSEPGAGSDLAGLHTRAERDGDEWIVNGQKVWSSGAHYSHYGILLARTDPEVPKHQGLTCFACPMDTPGVEVRPLRQMTGGAHFNEVFLTDARIADAHRIGDVNKGWDVARTLLANERMSLSGAEGAFSFDELAEAARARRDCVDAIMRDRIARLYTDVRTLDFLNARVITRLGRGETPTAEASIMKIKLAGIVTDGATLALALLGPGGMLDENGESRRF